MRRFIFKRKNISFFETESAIFCITIGYFNPKTLFIHLQPSFAVLSEEINILLIAPHWFCKGLYIDSSI